ncbi:acyl-CoA synthetase [Aliidongia dinghuensis]|uniref:Acyl-CoA synthetase n=1 Tax=Aliidongia dinghuensis TaxID=1867774 RepID=A0A8J2YTG0_9PROT|nr:acyl-CoA synthetase [Aliidongia dinghuensis]GGF18864.1 acyl-CoA synthetase [Aliidongia dinghuensis]
MPKVMNLGRLLTQAAERWPERAGLVQGERSWSWAELERRTNAMVAALRRRGIAPGDRVMIHARNGLVMFESLWVAFKLGAVWVPTNFRLTATEVAYLAEASGAKAMIYDRGFEDHADAARVAQRDLGLVLAIGTPRPGEAAYEALVAEPFEAAEAEPAEVDYDDTLWFFYTSGTTGRPKAAMLTHGQMAFVVTNHLADLMPGVDDSHASLVIAPLSHGAGIHALAQVARGAKSVLLSTERFDGAEAWELVERHRITNMFTVPSLLTMLVDHPAVDTVDHSSLRHVIYAGSPMYRVDQKRALEKLGPVIVQYYGLGEVTGNITVLAPTLHSLDDATSPAPIASCGVARTGTEIAILDIDGKRLPAGESGEICVRGPAVFKGYFNNPAANEKAFAHGWFHTGDLGFLDARGFLTITGRASDMYISGGSNVYPREIEEVLLAHPAVAEAAVVGLPHPKWGEAGIAVLVLRPGAAADAAEILAFLDGRIARYKRPARIVIWPELPKSGYGKVPKALVKQHLAERGEDQLA